jgi:hypothetical protein
MGSSVFMQLASQTPMFLAYLVAMVLAIVYWQRCPMPSLLTLIASGLLLGLALGQTVLTSYLIHFQSDMGGGAGIGSTLTMIGLAGNVLRALAFGLLLAAVFADRRRVEGPWTE